MNYTFNSIYFKNEDKEVLNSFFKKPEVRNELSKNNLSEVYELMWAENPVDSSYTRPLLTKFFTECGIDVLMYMDVILPYMFCATELIEIHLPEHLEHRIPEMAFANTDITEITVPGKIEFISKRAFYLCIYLNKIVMEEGVKELHPMCFYRIAKPANIYMPDSLTYIAPDIITDASKDYITFHCHKGTLAEAWCKEGGFTYHVI